MSNFKKKLTNIGSIETILRTIQQMFPNADIELKFSTPFQLLLAVVLSAQSTDKQVNKVTDKFFRLVKKPEDILKFSIAQLERQIKSIGLYKSKAKNIYNLSKQILEWTKQVKTWKKSIQDFCQTAKCKKFFDQYGYIIPDKFHILISLPGVGEKTAKVVLNVLYDLDFIPVDTHIHRISNRLWIVQTKTPNQTSAQLEKIIPSNWKKQAHHYLIFFGRYFCTAKNPKCEKCPFINICKYKKNR